MFSKDLGFALFLVISFSNGATVKIENVDSAEAFEEFFDNVTLIRRLEERYRTSQASDLSPISVLEQGEPITMIYV